jgi:hypothetical protein
MDQAQRPGSAPVVNCDGCERQHLNKGSSHLTQLIGVASPAERLIRATFADGADVDYLDRILFTAKRDTIACAGTHQCAGEWSGKGDAASRGVGLIVADDIDGA